MKNSSILNTLPMGFMWPVADPFLFCAHHLDHFPPGNDLMGPSASLRGRNIGQDFTIKDGWRMYHGDTIPGFPEHPHRGFETVTIVMKGVVDHSDSYGQSGRYAAGDVQWMTAGEGLQHSEMFPLLNKVADNPLELFQVWVNLPKAKKFAKPHFKMLWAEDIPVVKITNPTGKSVTINVIAGKLGNTDSLSPAPDSWAADPGNEVAIWTIHMEAGASWKLDPAHAEARRTFFFYRGTSLKVDGIEIEPYQAVELLASAEPIVMSGESDSYILLLQGKPILESVAQYGPFVMNTQAEIQQAIRDYQRTEFGGWPWPRKDMVHERYKGRFAVHTDGKEEIRYRIEPTTDIR